MALQQGFNLLADTVTNGTVFNKAWVLSAIVLILSLVLITRDMHKWKGLAFPIMIGWQIAGLKNWVMLWIVMAIVYVLDSLSLKEFGNLITNTIKTTQNAAQSVKTWQTARLNTKMMNAQEKAQLARTIKATGPSNRSEQENYIKQMAEYTKNNIFGQNIQRETERQKALQYQKPSIEEIDRQSKQLRDRMIQRINIPLPPPTITTPKKKQSFNPTPAGKLYIDNGPLHKNTQAGKELANEVREFKLSFGREPNKKELMDMFYIVRGKIGIGKK